MQRRGSNHADLYSVHGDLVPEDLLSDFEDYLRVSETAHALGGIYNRCLDHKVYVIQGAFGYDGVPTESFAIKSLSLLFNMVCKSFLRWKSKTLVLIALLLYRFQCLKLPVLGTDYLDEMIRWCW